MAEKHDPRKDGRKLFYAGTRLSGVGLIFALIAFWLTEPILAIPGAILVMLGGLFMLIAKFLVNRCPHCHVFIRYPGRFCPQCGQTLAVNGLDHDSR